MRIAFLSLLFLQLSVYFLYGKVLTFSSSPLVIAEYENIQEAIDVANPGDTIYIHGIADSCVLNKMIVVLGSGYNPQNSNKFPSTIKNIYLNGASNSKIQGLRCNITSKYGADSSNNVIVKQCLIDTIKISGNDWLILNCIFDKFLKDWKLHISKINVNYCRNIVIANNIFVNDRFKIYNSTNNSLLIKNNISYCNNVNSEEGADLFINISLANIYNNIFFGSADGAINSLFKNNTFYLTFADNRQIPYATNTGVDNIELENYGAIEFISDSSDGFQYHDDLHLSNDSPGKNAGTDGKDIGIYGGSYPWPDNSDGTPDYTGESNLPKVWNLSVTPEEVLINGSININSQGIKKR